jgi:hypothetical protein
MTYEDWAWIVLESVVIVSGLLVAGLIGILAVSGIVKAVRNFGR